MGVDYLPFNQRKLIAWAERFAREAAAVGQELRPAKADPLQPGELEALQAALAEFTGAVDGYQQLLNQVRAAMQRRRTTQAALEELLRNLAQRFRSARGITPPQIVRLGLPICRVGGPSVCAAELDAAPGLRLLHSSPQRHVLRVFDARTGRRARPHGVSGAEIFLAWREQDLGSLLGLFGSKPIIVHRDEAAGKIAHYIARWIDRRGRTSPWSEVLRARVA